MRVVIPGAATGIGVETVRLLTADGHEITALDIAKPANVDRWVQVDLSDMEATAAACASLEGPFDVLINNAGLPPRDGNQEVALAVAFA